MSEWPWTAGLLNWLTSWYDGGAALDVLAFVVQLLLVEVWIPLFMVCGIVDLIFH